MMDSVEQHEHDKHASNAGDAPALAGDGTAPLLTVSQVVSPSSSSSSTKHAPPIAALSPQPSLHINNDDNNKSTSIVSPELASAVRVCLRAYGVGFVFATVPKLIKTLVAFLLTPGKVTPKGQNLVMALLRAIVVVVKNGASAKKDGMSMLLMITLGGYKILEMVLARGMRKAILAQRIQQQQQQQQQQQNIQQSREMGQEQGQSQEQELPTSASTLVQWTRNDASKIQLPVDLQQQITMMASFLSSAAAVVFMHRKRPHHATIDYSLFAVVRGLDVFGHVAVKNRWGPSWLGSYGAVAVFVVACTEIMYSWMYEPERLPGPYAFWITRMARMDRRLLETLRAVRTGAVQFGQPNPPEVRGLLTGLCEDLGLDPKMVHLLPALLSPKAFFKRLQDDPVATATSTLLATARSSAFLASYIALIWYGICCWRSKIMPLFMKATGRRYTSNVVDNIYGPLLGAFMCGFSEGRNGVICVASRYVFHVESSHVWTAKPKE
ncbi:hypothetical protein EDD11_002026 [Mortierella claussenii]|nr:hypothetical protein EDD11_002026 [Mortierella claussenii]